MSGYFKNSRMKQVDYRKYRAPAVFNVVKPKETKEIKIPKAVWKYLFLLAIIIGIIYFFYYSSYFKINDVIIEGNSLVATADIEQLVSSGENIFQFNAKNTRNEILQKFPEISDVEIFRGLPNAIKIVVLERDRKMVWQSGGINYLVSGEGIATKIVTNPADAKDLPTVIDKQNLPVVQGTMLASPAFVEFINEVNKDFFNTVNIHPTHFEITETTFTVNLYTDAGFYVKLNSLRSAAKQLSDLKAILVAHRPDVHEYVDLRVDGWGYYK